MLFLAAARRGFRAQGEIQMTVRLAAAAAALLIAAPIAAAETGWTGIGHREVNDSVDRDTIRARGGHMYRQIMLCVERAPVRLYELVVRYRNGGSQNVRIRALVPAGRCSRNIDLRGRNRDIEAVDFTYEAASLGRQRARVELFGR